MSSNVSGSSFPSPDTRAVSRFAARPRPNAPLGKNGLLNLLLSLLVLLSSSELLAIEEGKLKVAPATIRLRGRLSSQQVLLTTSRDGVEVDLTRRAEFRPANEDLLRIDGQGIVTAIGSGRTEVVIRYDKNEVRLPVEILQGETWLPVTFEQDIQPVLTKLGCNAGTCHGKQRGQNGFQLSLLGFDHDFDFDALVREGRGRRVFPASPANSLLLRKAAALTPHGGGKRIAPAGKHYNTLKRWIAAGLPRTPPETPELQRISVFPSERIMRPRTGQQLLVTAHYSDGNSRDVTRLAAYQSNESPIARVGKTGLVQAGPLPGEAAIMTRYMGKFATCSVSIPLEGEVSPEYYRSLESNNFIDELVWKKLERLKIKPSPQCGDSEYFRRVYIDVIGRLPSPAETRTFLSGKDPAKRRELVDSLLARPEYADHWANKWVDLLRPNPYRVGIKAVRSLDRWVRKNFRENKPYDRFVHDLLTSQGSTFRNGAVTVFRDRRSPEELVTMFSQLFLGIRLECARCHQHPFEIWSQKDFYSLAAYFAKVGRKGTGLSPPISGSEEYIFTKAGGEVRHPRTNEILPPRPLFGDSPALSSSQDPRQALALWMMRKDNGFFPAVMVNRVWADLMGRGIVEPVDDIRESNPPSNKELLDALALHFREVNYDLKTLLRTILASRVYSLSSRPIERNIADTRNYSRHYRQRLRAEVLLDGVCDITGIPEKFSAMPPGSRAAELWTHRTTSNFLDTFGRPDPNQDPPCMRIEDTTVVQALHLMNAPNLDGKIRNENGRAATLAASKMSPEEIVEELYLLVYARYPQDKEMRAGSARIPPAGTPVKGRRSAVEDLLWALLNTPEFLFKD